MNSKITQDGRSRCDSASVHPGITVLSLDLILCEVGGFYHASHTQDNRAALHEQMRGNALKNNWFVAGHVAFLGADFRAAVDRQTPVCASSSGLCLHRN